ncbi:AraC family transcriptional regulator [Butyricicoccus faecihominis]|uniref:helix-turn-helix transcriptional regulator n=1 Tax=Butyricicoccus faecihominis TaxID=1712515 RepID=UPI002478FC0A|nr:AraC family transcriptional regulator [Butyricicoccus faecihominis]MCQ5129876.1 AraC family transcriptional regulator [Butyricicoccus faecihominis]
MENIRLASKGKQASFQIYPFSVMPETDRMRSSQGEWRAGIPQIRTAEHSAVSRINAVYEIKAERLKRNNTFLERLLCGDLDGKYFQELFPKRTTGVGMILFSMDVSKLLNMSLLDQHDAILSCMKQCGWEGHVFSVPQSIFTLLLEEKHTQALEQRFTQFAQQLNAKFGFTILTHISAACENTVQLGAELQNSMTRMRACQYYHHSLPGISRSVPLNELKACRREIEKLCCVCCFDQAVLRLKEFVQKAHAEFCRPSSIKNAVMRLLYAFEPGLEENGGDRIYDSGQSTVVEQIMEADSPSAMEGALENFGICMLKIKLKGNHDESEPIVQVLDYIRHNYWRPLRQDEVAVAAHLNKSYLSQLFQKKLGMTYSRYLEYVRIQEAKRLLRTTNKTAAEIAEAVGFSGQNYFAKIFKSEVGVSPIKFRNGGCA